MTVLQFAKGLTDRQAADAVRGRIDWKDALGLELSDPGFDYSVLSEFRSRLLAGSAEERLLTAQLKLFQARGLVKAGGRQRTDSTHVLAVIHQLNRLELVGESLRHALNELALVAPDWLVTVAQPDWYARYGRCFDSFHLPESREKRQALAPQIGVDGHRLLAAALASAAPPEAVRAAPCLQVMRQIWVQQYYIDASGDEAVVCMRESGNLPPSDRCICSPYDVEARYARHNEQVWVGYRTHLTESCDPAAEIHIITQVETVLAPIQDVEVVATVHADLAEQGLKPKQHYIDAAYLSADLRVSTAQKEAVELIDPVTKLQNVSWQAKEKTATILPSFRSTGTPSRPPVRKGKLPSNGTTTFPIATATPAFRSTSRPQPVRRVPRGPPARAASRAGARFGCSRRRNTKPYGKLAPSRLQQLSPRSIGPD